jgi:hypothetical protein
MAIVATLRFGAVYDVRAPRYNLGDSVTVWADFRDDISGALSAASGVAFAVVRGDGTTAAAPSVVTEAAGIYRATFTPNIPGVWQVSASGTVIGLVSTMRELAVADQSVSPTLFPLAAPAAPLPPIVWNAVAYTPPSGYARLLNTKLTEVEVSLLDFAAAGETDIALWLRRARDAGAFGGQRIIRMPEGNFTHSSIDPLGAGYGFNLTGYSNFWLRGAGRGVTVIQPVAGTDMSLFRLSTLSNARFSDFTYDGDRANQTIPDPTRPNKHGIGISALTNVQFQRLDILNAQAYGIGFQTGNFIDLTVEDVRIIGAGTDGMDIKNPGGLNRNIRIEGCYFEDCGRASTTVAKAWCDVRGAGTTVSNCVSRLTSAAITAANHALFRVRPDDSSLITYENATVLPEEEATVTGVTSGATAVINARSGSSTLAVGGISLRDVVGTFTATERINFSSGGFGFVRSYSPPSANGGGGAVLIGCQAQGPTDGVSGVGFVVLDEDVSLIAPRAADVRTGISVQTGGIRSSVVAPFIARAEIGIDYRAGGGRCFGGSFTDITDASIDIVSANDITIDAPAIADSTRGVRRNATSLRTRLTNPQFSAVTTPLINFDYGDQPSTLPRVSGRSGSLFSILPTPSYATAAALVGGAGGAANSTIYFCPIPIFDRTSILRLGLVIGTSTAATLGKLALYRDIAGSPAGGSASNLIAECSGTVDFSGTANTQIRVSFASAIILEPGLYWGAVVCNGGARPYTVPVTGAMGEWARFVGINNGASMFAGTGGQCRVSSTSLVDYNAAFPAIGPAVDFATTTPGSPWIGAWEG